MQPPSLWHWGGQIESTFDFRATLKNVKQPQRCFNLSESDVSLSNDWHKSIKSGKFAEFIMNFINGNVEIIVENNVENPKNRCLVVVNLHSSHVIVVNQIHFK